MYSSLAVAAGHLRKTLEVKVVGPKSIHLFRVHGASDQVLIDMVKVINNWKIFIQHSQSVVVAKLHLAELFSRPS